ncbi:hypothetical protein BDF22DRAFT_739559 [Syncephalis plumigaleata]|nr:hypothetical protein BDF22DRAFT_739559 [Syncephalis plumigaleata]
MDRLPPTLPNHQHHHEHQQRRLHLRHRRHRRATSSCLWLTMFWLLVITMVDPSLHAAVATTPSTLANAVVGAAVNPPVAATNQHANPTPAIPAKPIVAPMATAAAAPAAPAPVSNVTPASVAAAPTPAATNAATATVNAATPSTHASTPASASSPAAVASAPINNNNSSNHSNGNNVAGAATNAASTPTNGGSNANPASGPTNHTPNGASAIPNRGTTTQFIRQSQATATLEIITPVTTVYAMPTGSVQHRTNSTFDSSGYGYHSYNLYMDASPIAWLLLLHLLPCLLVLKLN